MGRAPSPGPARSPARNHISEDIVFAPRLLSPSKGNSSRSPLVARRAGSPTQAPIARGASPLTQSTRSGIAVLQGQQVVGCDLQVAQHSIIASVCRQPSPPPVGDVASSCLGQPGQPLAIATGSPPPFSGGSQVLAAMVVVDPCVKAPVENGTAPEPSTKEALQDQTASAASLQRSLSVSSTVPLSRSVSYTGSTGASISASAGNGGGRASPRAARPASTGMLGGASRSIMAQTSQASTSMLHLVTSPAVADTRIGTPRGPRSGQFVAHTGAHTGASPARALSAADPQQRRRSPEPRAAPSVSQAMEAAAGLLQASPARCSVRTSSAPMPGHRTRRSMPTPAFK